MKISFIVILLLSFILGIQQSEVRLPKKFVKPDKWVEADRIANRSLRKQNAEDLNKEKAFAIIDSESDLMKLLLAKEWCRKNYRECFPQLINKLTDTTYVGLTDFFDTMVPGRNEKAQIYGHYGIINEDIYLRAGRASYILNQITGEDFAIVRHDTEYKKLDSFRKSWISYIKALKKK